MADFKDSAIKLFGKTIPLRRSEEVSCADEPSVAVSAVDSDAGESCSDRKVLASIALTDENSGEDEEDKETSGKEQLDPEKDTICDQIDEENRKDPPTSAAVIAENLDSASAEQSEISDSQDKTLKKPDKIIPCPRCNSMDTKFCYYNNYNVNQPRHFCKNCQRYWTAGGTMRNVPVGAGRRKNKNSSASHYRHLVISDALHRAQANASNATVLTFGSDNHSSCSSVTASNSSEKGGKPIPVTTNDHYQLPCFAGPPWPYPWNSSPGFCHSGFPVSFYPASPYWGSAVAGSWNNVQCFSPTSSTSNQSMLKKHSRDGEILNRGSAEKDGPVKENVVTGSDRSVLIPKTLRIDDPTEAAKSSIWATLGIKNEKLGLGNGSGLFKAFQSKGDGKSQVLETSPVLQANPAALSRSLRFLEST